METWKHGNKGKMGIWKYGNMGIWIYGNMGIWRTLRALAAFCSPSAAITWKPSSSKQFVKSLLQVIFVCLAPKIAPDQGPTGRGFQLRDGSGSGIGKHISGRIGYRLGTGIFIMYLNNRVLPGSANLERVFSGISLCHIYFMVPDGF